MTMFKTLATATLLASAMSTNPVAASEDKYPAYNFQPSVIFSDAALIEKTHGALATTPSAGGVAASAPATLAAVAHEVDPKYPAAYFNPTILVPAK